MAEHRDPEIIKRDIEICELKASNLALQADGLYSKIELMHKVAGDCKTKHDAHLETKAQFENELKAALTTPPDPPAE